MDTINFLRSKLVKQDAYELARIDQNNGSHCIHCQCTSGHFGTCPLINREIAEAKNALAGTFTELDQQYLHALGVSL